jgi:hypothetical protein
MEQPGIGSSPSLEASLDADGRVAGDVPCLQCGYNLRTLRVEGACPECGAPVIKSLDTVRLLFADLRWLQVMVRGLDLALLGVVLLPVMGIAAAELVNRVRLPTATIAWDSALPWLVAMSPNIIIGCGIWMLTRAEPGHHGNERRKLRRTIRIAGLTSCVLYPAVPIIGAPGDAAQAMFYLWCLTVTVFGFSALFYGRWLARRMGSEVLEGWVVVLVVIYAMLLVGAGIGYTPGLFSTGGSLGFLDVLYRLFFSGFIFWALLGGVTAQTTFCVAVAFRVSLARLVRWALRRSASPPVTSA